MYFPKCFNEQCGGSGAILFLHITIRLDDGMKSSLTNNKGCGSTKDKEGEQRY